jgi:hypothetical protein
MRNITYLNEHDMNIALKVELEIRNYSIADQDKMTMSDFIRFWLHVVCYLFFCNYKQLIYFFVLKYLHWYTCNCMFYSDLKKSFIQ